VNQACDHQKRERSANVRRRGHQVQPCRAGQQHQADTNGPRRPEPVHDAPRRRAEKEQWHRPLRHQQRGWGGVEVELCLPRGQNGDDERIPKEINKESRHKGHKDPPITGIVGSCAQASSSEAGSACSTSAVNPSRSSTVVSSVKSESEPWRCNNPSRS